MSTAFICGYMPKELCLKVRMAQINRRVCSFISDNNIDRIFMCKRTDFDLSIFMGLVANHLLDFNNIEIIELVDGYKMDFEYRMMYADAVKFKRLCPFDKELDNKVLYKSLYDYAIEHSDFMITYARYDNDISLQVMERAKEKGLKIYNIADDVESGILNDEPNDAFTFDL